MTHSRIDPDPVPDPGPTREDYIAAHRAREELVSIRRQALALAVVVSVVLCTAAVAGLAALVRILMR